MKIVLGALIFLPLFATAQSAPAPSIAGDWSGSLKTPNGVLLPLVLHLKSVQGNAFQAQLDSPAQGGYGIPAQQTTVSGNQLTVEIPSLHANYQASVSKDGKTLSGTFTQGNAAMPLVLQQTESAAEIAQTKPSPIQGDWKGAILGGETVLPVIFHFRTMPEGMVHCAFDSPAQHAFGIACTDVKLTGRRLTFSAPAVHGDYTGTLSADGSKISGAWSQAKMLPLALTRESGDIR